MKIVKFILRLALGAGLLAYLIHEHERSFDSVASQLLHIPLTCIVGAILLDLAGQTLCAWRWSLLTAKGGRPIGMNRTFPIYFSGMFFNICLPTAIGGDVIKTVGLGRQMGSKSAAFASVFMDRNVGLAALLTLGLFSSLMIQTTLQVTVRHQLLTVHLWWLFLILAAGYVLANVILFGDTLFNWVDRIVLRLAPQKVREKVEKLHFSLQLYRQSVTGYLGVFTLSMLYQIMECGSVWLLGHGLGLELPFWVFATMVTFQAIAGLLPITINNIGVREGIFCAILLGQTAASGLSEDKVKDEGMALALAYLLLIIFSGLVGGIVYLVSGLPKPSQMEEDAEKNSGVMPQVEPEPKLKVQGDAHLVAAPESMEQIAK